MTKTINGPALAALLCGALCVLSLPSIAQKAGGGGGGTGAVDTIKVSKCYYVASNGEMLINAGSSSTAAHLYVYLPSGAYVCEVQNGGGGKYGGTVFYIGSDPGFVTIQSSAGGSVSVATTPFQL